MRIYITAVLLFIISIVNGQDLLTYPGIPLNTNFNTLTNQPLDGRDTIRVLADTIKLNPFAYKGQITYAYDTDTRWEYNGFGWQPLSYSDGYLGNDLAAGTATYALAGSLNLDYTLGDFDVDSVRYFYITPRANQGGNDSYIYLGRNNTHNLQVYSNGVGSGFSQLGNINNFIYFGATTGKLDIATTSTGFEILDGRSPATAAGLEYNDSYTYGFTDLSLVHKSYVDSLVIGGVVGGSSRYTVIDSSHSFSIGDLVAPSAAGWYLSNSYISGDSIPLAMVLGTTTHTFDIYADTVTLIQFDSITVGEFLFLHSDGILYDTPDSLNIPVARKLNSNNVFSVIDYRPYLASGIAGSGSGGGSGEANTASSVGSGVSLFYQKTGINLAFNSIKSETSLLNVTLDGVSHDIELTVNPLLSVYTNDIGFLTTVPEDSVTQYQAALSITESQISDLAHTSEEQVEDFVGGLIVSGDGIFTSYNDVGGLLTIRTSQINPFGGSNNHQAVIDSMYAHVSVFSPGLTNHAVSGATHVINLGSYRDGIHQIDCTSASSPLTLTINNPIDQGVYTFHALNTSSTDIVYPANFFFMAGGGLVGTVSYAQDDGMTCYYDAANNKYYCK